MNYYRRYIGDYQRDTPHLSLAEHGAYTVLLDAYYANGGKVPADHGDLWRLCRAFEDYERKAVARIADEFFPVNGDGTRHNKRADKELAIAAPAIEAMRAAGRQGAAKRWGSDRAPYRVGNGVAIEPPTTNHQPPAVNLNPVPAVINPPEKVKSTARGARLAVLAGLPPEWREWAKSNRPDLNPESVFEEFKDYWQATAGSKGVKLDWFATWRNWCRRQNGSGKAGSSASAAREAERLIFGNNERVIE
jgi:uncharacterized protein YdaU (DUF1376 family)